MRGDTMRSFLWALGGTLFTFIMTALGAALVFCFKNSISDRTNRLCFGFSGGVMSAAAVFSLLLPAVEQIKEAGGFPVVTTAVGFSLGAGLMLLLDACLSHMQIWEDDARRKRTLLMSAVTLHNIPEGMAVGLSFALAAQGGAAALAGACALALGIGVQNIPEGAAIALPLSQSGMSRRRSFAVGALSGAVEPMAGLLTAMMITLAAQAMPMLMCLSAGAMMFVVFAEMLPEAGAARDGTLAAAIGYVLMMALDIGLG